MRPLRMSTAVLGSILGLLGLACGGDSNAPEPPTATRIAINFGNNQSAAAGSAVAISPSVIVTDAGGSPVSGVAVTFAVGSGDGSVTGASQTTNASGIATVGSWTLGSAVGANTLTATAAGLNGSPVTFTATGTLTFVAVSAGFVHTCGLTPTGAAYCWGHNYYGQLGNGSTTEADGSIPTSIPTAVSGDQSFSALVAGDAHTCGLMTSGAAYCWGYNVVGQLGTGSTTNSSIPVAVSGNLVFSDLVADGFRTCGLTTAGVAYCWGSNVFGQLGVGATTGPGSCFIEPESPPEACSTAPVPVSGGLTFSALTAGTFHSCGVVNSGAAYCWGHNDTGQLGDGSTTSSSTPVLVSGGQNFSALAAGNPHTCGLVTSGAAYCWGGGDNGQMGDGSLTSVNPIPVAVLGGQSFTALAAGSVHTCGITSSGAAFCWGGGPALGTSTPVNPISAVAGGHSFIAIAAGDVHSCGVTSSGLAYCWGDNYLGQLGDGTTDLSRVPVRVAGQ